MTFFIPQGADFDIAKVFKTLDCADFLCLPRRSIFAKTGHLNTFLQKAQTQADSRSFTKFVFPQCGQSFRCISAPL